MADKKQGIDQALIRDLANILNETDLTEIEVEQDELRIRVSRAGTPQYVSAPVPAAQFAAPIAAPAAAPTPAAVPAARDNKNAVTVTRILEFTAEVLVLGGSLTAYGRTRPEADASA